MASLVVAAMEEVQQRAGEQECVRDQPEEVLPVFRIEQESSDQRGRSRGQQPRGPAGRVQSAILLRRSELPMTLTEESAIAAAAMIGESMMPNSG